MLHNETNPKQKSIPMSLLMNFTLPKAIEWTEGFTPNYDDVNQIVYDMRTVGTKCLKTTSAVRGCADKKNEMDDSKSVN